ncbi:MAG: ThuA domain-containing protein [Halanaerobiales bacterium]|nr:ThuA domain-containing protein [Halanaerobiales bacterium]
MDNINVLVWSEYRQARKDPEVKNLYPEGINSYIANFLKENQINTSTAHLDQKEHGLSKKKLAKTDVLIWWGHRAHEEVSDEIVERVHKRVLSGMGLIVLHSAHYSKIFKKLMGTSCSLKWREDSELERLWITSPGHPIVKGITGDYIELQEEEMYGEYFDVPNPDQIIFTSWFEGGEVFRSGITYKRGQGKIFYFRPGHESNPTYHNKTVQKVLKNAVKWANNTSINSINFGNSPEMLN